jgi:tetratricopeptide (TPR) repeat protein
VQAVNVTGVSDIDPTDPVVVLCAAGMQAEGAGDIDGARALFEEAWNAATSDYQGCIAAHYLARNQRDPADTLKWNERCLTLADAVGDESVSAFYPSAYLNIGSTLEQLGRWQAAEEAYREADEVLSRLGDDGYGRLVRDAVARCLSRLADHRDAISGA